jgi:steroid delta-isomerase-like uncharacterized protein
MSELNKQVVRRFLDEVINGQRFDLLPDLFDGNFVWHGGSFGETRGLEEFAAVVEPFYKAFPDLRIEVDDLFGEDDRVVARFTVKATHQGHFLGVPATGKKVKWTGQPIYRLEGGKIVEEWFAEDTFGLMQALGAFPARAEAPA